MIALTDLLPSDWQLEVVVGGLSLVVAVLILGALRKLFVTRTEFARLLRKFENLSDDVKGLLRAEERRFITELKAPKKDADEPPADA
jgi:hypothetical protein